MKNKIIKLSLITLLSLFPILTNANFYEVNLANARAVDVQIVPVKVSEKSVSEKFKTEITNRDMYIYASTLLKTENSDYKNISLKLTGYNSSDKLLVEALQILVANNAIQNSGNIRANLKVTSKTFYTFIGKISKDSEFSKIASSNSRNATYEEISYAMQYFGQTEIIENESPTIEIVKSEDIDVELKMQIFNEIYQILLSEYYYSDGVSKEELLNAALRGLAEGANDPYTTYFPPVETKSFFEDLGGEFEGIGAYVDMEKPGEVKIISPIKGTPADLGGLKSGDIIIEIDSKKISENMSLQSAVELIKGKAGTKVKLKILRESEELNFEITRGLVRITNVSTENFHEGKTKYIQIKTFGENVESEFFTALEEIDEKTENIIFDLRGNPGGYLDQVTLMLSHFIERGKPVSVVKTKTFDEVNYSKGLKFYDLSKYNIVILQDEGSASASEIMIGTLHDYFPEITLVGGKTYGKGSVQTTYGFPDGSMLKYTIARWYTGKTETLIDGVGISPEIEIAYDSELFKKEGKDNQLEKALEILGT